MAPSQTSMGGIGMRATHRRDRPRESPSGRRAAPAGSVPAKREARRLAALPLATRRQAMAVLAVGLRTFAELEGNGTITAARPGRGGRPSLYRLDVIVPKYLAHLGQARPGAEDREARARRDRAQAELLDLTIAERRRHLLPREQVVLEGQAFVKAMTAKLRALPRRLAQADLIAREHEGAVAALVREALDEISRWASMLDLLDAARGTSS